MLQMQYFAEGCQCSLALVSAYNGALFMALHSDMPEIERSAGLLRTRVKATASCKRDGRCVASVGATLSMAEVIIEKG